MGLKILHWNARSIRNKKPELLNLLSRVPYDILLILETKLKDTHRFNLPHYKSLRYDSHIIVVVLVFG